MHVPEYIPKHISTATTTAVKDKTGVLHAITVNTTAAGTITVNDASGAIAVLKASVAEGTYTYDVACQGKIEVVTAAASDITVAYL